jgi:hypothetical protein
MLEPLTQGQFRALIGLFIVAVISAVMWCLQVYWTSGPDIENDVRKISVFISHVRFSLLIALALGLLVRFAHGSAQGRLLIALVSIPSFVLYPIIVNGKPYDWRTVPAFFPIMFELTVLFSAFTAVGTMF